MNPVNQSNRNARLGRTGTALALALFGSAVVPGVAAADGPVLAQADFEAPIEPMYGVPPEVVDVAATVTEIDERDDGQYDLTQWDSVYWQRFQQFLTETQKRKIVVQIEVWDRFDYTDQGGKNHWQGHPYHPKNNINYFRLNSTIDMQYAFKL